MVGDNDTTEQSYGNSDGDAREKDTRAGGVSPSRKNTNAKPHGLMDIYAQFDPPLAKLPNLPKLIAKSLESNLWGIF
jgi:hypothetical protein